MNNYMYVPSHMCIRIEYVRTTSKNLILKNILDIHVGMEKEQNQELGWRVSVLPIPAFHRTVCMPVTHNDTRPMIYHTRGRASACQN